MTDYPTYAPRKAARPRQCIRGVVPEERMDPRKVFKIISLLLVLHSNIRNGAQRHRTIVGAAHQKRIFPAIFAPEAGAGTFQL